MAAIAGVAVVAGCATLLTPTVQTMLGCGTMAVLASQAWLLETTVGRVLLGVLLCVGAVLYFRTLRRSARAGRGRSLSFTSGLMAGNIFPDRVEEGPSVLTCMMYLERLPTQEQIYAQVKLLCKFDRFGGVLSTSQGPVDPSSGTANENASDLYFKPTTVALKQHVRVVDVQNTSDLHSYVEETLTKPLAAGPGAPLWEIHLIQNACGMCAMLYRVDHVLGDGISLMRVVTRIFEDADGNPLNPEGIFRQRTTRPKGFSFDTLSRIVTAAKKVLTLASSPHDSNIAFTHPDKQHMKYSPKKKILVLPQVRLNFIKALKNAAGDGTTVNDVLCCVAASAIREYSIRKNDAAVQFKKDLQIRALLPVAFPRPESEASDPMRALRNKFAFVSAEMAVNGSDERERLLTTRRIYQQLKNSPEAPVQLWIQNTLLPLLPMSLVRQITFDSMSRHSLVFSNVPGPADQFYISGIPVEGVQVFYPNIVHQGLMISYNGRMFMNFVFDADVVDDPALFGRCFMERLHALADQLRVSHAVEDVVDPATDAVGQYQWTTSMHSDGVERTPGKAVSRDSVDRHSSGAKASWREAAGRDDGSAGYQFGDLARVAYRKMAS